MMLTKTGTVRKRNANGSTSSMGLAYIGFYPTPRKQSANGTGVHGEGGMDLQTFVTGLLPKPTASDSTEKNTGKRNQAGLQKMAFDQTGQTSQLSPLFVQEMMGFPENWLVYPFQNGEMSQ